MKIVNFIQRIFMSADNIKQKFHKLIDEMDDEEALQMLYEDALGYKASCNIVPLLQILHSAESLQSIHQLGKF